MRPRDRFAEDEGPNFWPAVADAFIGFLALVLIAGLAAFTDATAKGQEPPPAKQDFQKEFEKAFVHPQEVEMESRERPKVQDEGFSELNIYFPAKFLFLPCHADLMTPAATELSDLRDLFKRYDHQILRVQITGHTDTDHPGGECYKQGIRTNWELSARRAITVLELLAPDDSSGLDPHKVWAAALGEYHPVDQGNDPDAKARNRRIEVLVRFREAR
jgi:flagellar motor protein MotB